MEDLNADKVWRLLSSDEEPRLSLANAKYHKVSLLLIQYRHIARSRQISIHLPEALFDISHFIHAFQHFHRYLGQVLDEVWRRVERP